MEGRTVGFGSSVECQVLARRGFNTAWRDSGSIRWTQRDRNGVYSVEEVALGGERWLVWIADERDPASRSGHCEPRHRLHFRQLTEVLGGSGEVELVFCAIGTAQAQAIQL